MLHIHQGTVMYRRGRVIYLDDMNYIFTCPAEDCEYVMSAMTEDGAETIRNTHLRICHPQHHAETLWDEAFNKKIFPEYVLRQNVFVKVCQNPECPALGACGGSCTRNFIKGE